MEARQEAGTKNKPEDKGASKRTGTYTSTETGKGERKPREEYSRLGRKAAPEFSDESEDVENPDLVDKTSVLLMKCKVKGKGKSKDKDTDCLQGPPRSQP